MHRRQQTPLFTREEIAACVKRLAAVIRHDYRDKNPLLIGVLKSSFIFLADLVREIDIPLTVDFVRAQSYESTSSTGAVKLFPMEHIALRGRHVLLVEDIVDTGRTLTHLVERLKQEEPASLKLCALLDKPSGRVAPVQADYLGLNVPDVFVVGYGIDVDQQYRYLPDIYALDKD